MKSVLNLLTCHTADGFLACQIGDVNEGVVEGGKNATDCR